MLSLFCLCYCFSVIFSRPLILIFSHRSGLQIHRCNSRICSKIIQSGEWVKSLFAYSFILPLLSESSLSCNKTLIKGESGRTLRWRHWSSIQFEWLWTSCIVSRVVLSVVNFPISGSSVPLGSQPSAVSLCISLLSHVFSCFHVQLIFWKYLRTPILA